MSDFEERARKAAESVRRQIDDATPNEDRDLKRAKRSSMRTVVPSSMAVVAVIAASLFFLPGGGKDTTANTPYVLAGALKPFDACTDALQYFKDKAPQYYIDNVGGGRVYSSQAVEGMATPNSSAGAAEDKAAAAPQAPTAGTNYSTTNVQELGVDEPDIIKTDGNTIVAVAQGKVYVIAANNGQPAIKSTLDGTGATNVFLSGNRLLVFSNGNYYGGIQPMDSSVAGAPAPSSIAPYYQGQFGSSKSTMTLYDIGDMAKPQKVAAMSVDGQILDARLVGSQVRVATASSPNPDIPSPTYNNQGQVDQKSKDALPAAVAKTTIEDWLPQYSVTNAKGNKVASGSLVDCDKVAHPETFSGVDTVAVTSFDINSLLTDTKSVGVVAGGQKIYATANNLYVTSTDYAKDGNVTSTNIHEFTTAPDGVSTYKGSGSVDGTLINEYSMSEYKDTFRVATTLSGTRGWINPRSSSEGMVTTFRSDGKTLKQVGQVKGLGKEDNESITAVRFVDDKAYVTTARQTDPLFVIDLSKPEAPKVAGELKIPGSSSYLHPLANNLVLGVGQDGSGGLQFSLFDVSDATAPKRVGTLTYGSGQAPATSDPKAFLYWMPRNLVIAPANLYGNIETPKELPVPSGGNTSSSGGAGTSSIKGYLGDQFSGLILMQADGTTLKEIGRLADVQSNGGYVNRSIVIGDNVYLLSYDNLQVNNLDTHKDTAHLPLR